MANKTAPICLLDFETGGFDSKINPVVEIAAITFDGDTLEEICRYECILKPYDSELLYNPDALVANGINMDMINNGTDLKQFTSEFITFLRKSNIYTHPKFRLVLAGHNIQFDIKFLQHVFYYMNKKIQDYFNCSEDFYGNQYPHFIDTLRLAQLKWANDSTMVDHKLGTCIQKAGFELINAHRAMADVKGNTDLLHYFIKELRQENTQTIVQETRFRDKFKF
jgi:DNA polymerase III epsilon subunit-like protein